MAILNIKAVLASAQSRATDSPGVTLVAAYGNDKPDQFAQLLSDLKDYCGAATNLADWIHLYSKVQIHATVVGLEGKRYGDSIVQDNMSTRHGGPGPGAPMNFAAMLRFFRSWTSDVPVVVGGFESSVVNPFELDARRTPFLRSFDIRPDGLLVAMGWPYTDGTFMPHLIGLRKYLEAFNIVHKYHVRPQDQDNDLFFVVGEIDASRWESASAADRTSVQHAIDRLVEDCRQRLSKHPYAFSLRTTDLYVVKYLRTSLAEVSFAEQVSATSVSGLVSLYP